MDVNPLSFIFLGGMFNQTLTPISQTSIPRPIYHYSLVLFSGLTFIFYLGAASLIDPTRRWRLSRRQLWNGVSVLLILAALTMGGFLTTAPHYEWYKVTGSATPVVNPTNVPIVVPAMGTRQVILPADTLSTPIPSATPPGGG